MNKELFEREKLWLLGEKYGVKNESFLEGGKISDFSADLQRLKNGEPLAFIIGFVDFLNCKIDLEFKPLIPRTETEFWVENFIKKELKDYTVIQLNSCITKTESSFEKKLKSKIEILDIFSGSGCVGVSILKNTKNVFVDFSELNPKFTKQIKKNISINFTTSKACTVSENRTSLACWKIYQSDVFKNIPTEKKYDFILANPPYIPESKSEKVQDSVKNHEDYNSLFAADNGLYFVKKVILEGLPRLKKNGKVFIEFDETSKKEIESFLKKENLKNYKFKKDQFNNDRVLIIWN